MFDHRCRISAELVNVVPRMLVGMDEDCYIRQTLVVRDEIGQVAIGPQQLCQSTGTRASARGICDSHHGLVAAVNGNRVGCGRIVDDVDGMLGTATIQRQRTNPGCVF